MFKMMHKLMSFMGLAATIATTPHAPLSGTRTKRDTSLPRPTRKRSGHCGKMRIFKSMMLFAMLALASTAYAQEVVLTRGPLPVGAKVKWEAPANITTITDALSFEARFSINGVPATALTSVTCATAVAPLTGITCESVLNASNRDALNRIGRHSVNLVLFRADVGEGEVSAPFALTTPAGRPANLRLSGS